MLAGITFRRCTRRVDYYPSSVETEPVLPRVFVSVAPCVAEVFPPTPRCCSPSSPSFRFVSAMDTGGEEVRAY